MDGREYGGLGLRGHSTDRIPAAGRLTALVVPTVFRGQPQPDIKELRGRLAEIAELTSQYYVENSFGNHGDPNSLSFGFDIVGQAKGLEAVRTPVELPGTALDYWWGPFIQPGFRLMKAIRERKTTILVPGNETFTLTLKPRAGHAEEARTLTGTCPAVLMELRPINGRLSFKNESFGLTLTAAGVRLDLDVRLGTADFDATLKAAEASAAAIRLHVQNQLILSMPPGGVAPHVRVQALRGTKGDIRRLLLALEAPNGWSISDRRVTGAPPGTTAGPSFPLSLGIEGAGQRQRFARYWQMVLCFAEAASLNTGTLGSESDRWIDDEDVDVAFDWPGGDVSPGKLVVKVSLSKRVAGPGSEVSIEFTQLTGFDSKHAEIVPASTFTSNDEWAPRKPGRLLDDANRLLIEALQGSGMDPADILTRYSYFVLALPALSAVSEPDPPGDYREFNIEHAVATSIGENGNLIKTAPPPTKWTALFVKPRTPEGVDSSASTFIHETGHALGLPDLYFQNGYRQDLAYLDDLSPMDKQIQLPHHCGPHKMQLGWIPAGRTVSLSRLSDKDGRCEAWLAPVEVWDDDIWLQLDALALAEGPDVKAAHLLRLRLGGDGIHDIVVEARTPGTHFGLQTPAHVLVSNARHPEEDTRVIVDDLFRRSIQQLAELAPGDFADLGSAAALPAAGVSVRSLETRVLTGIDGHPCVAHHVVLEWHDAPGVDLSLTKGTHAWDSPDVWVDWPGDGPTTFPPGQPTSQGDTVRIPARGSARHQAVARVHNLGNASATNVEVRFDSASPPTAGDGNWVPRATGTTPLIPPGDFREVGADFYVQAGQSGHFCLRAQVSDCGVAAGGAADEKPSNDQAQKNVTRIQIVGASPYQPVDFQIEVTNAGPVEERAFLIPVGFGEGSSLTVKQSEVLVPARGSATFDVTIALDIDEVPFGERYDFITQLAVWRRTSHSCEPWGGCSVIVEPRLESTCTAHVASWLRGHDLNLEGTVPGATGGQVTVEAYLSTEQGPEVRFSQASLTHTGDWAGAIPAADATYAEVRAHFDGNSVLARSDSPTLNASPKDIA